MGTGVLTRTLLGNRDIFFRFLENSGTSQFISGEQGNRYPLRGPQGLNQVGKLGHYVYLQISLYNSLLVM